MLFHGTTRKNEFGILKKGLRNSSKGWFGKGVYMTDCSDVAINFSDFLSTRYRCIFLNEVLELEKLHKLEFDYKKIIEREKDISTKPKHQFEKHMFKSST